MCVAHPALHLPQPQAAAAHAMARPNIRQHQSVLPRQVSVASHRFIRRLDRIWAISPFWGGFWADFLKKRSLISLIAGNQPDSVSEIEYQGHISPDKGLITRYQSVADISLIY